MSKPTKRKSKLLKQQDKLINGTTSAVANTANTVNREAWNAAWDGMGLDAVLSGFKATDSVGDTDQFIMPLESSVSASEPEEPLRDGSADVALLNASQEANTALSDASIRITSASSDFDITNPPSGLRVVEGSAFSVAKIRPADYLETVQECREYLNFADNERLVNALALASVGIRVFPATPLKKKPSVNGWQTEATTDFDRIMHWFGSGHANVAVATGATDGGYELVVVDIDTKHGAVGFEGLRELEASLGKLPDTLTATTPSGCKHLYYRARGGLGVASRKLKTAGGDDVGDFQAAGKLVVAPPSVFADPDDGYTHKPYKWANDLPIAELPEAWIAPQATPYVPKYPSNPDAGTLIRGQDALDALATLNHISADVGYEDWKDITALLHNVDGGREAWLSWTQRGEKFRDGDEAKWDQVASMQLASGGNVAKLFALASNDPSYVNPKSRKAQKSDVPEGMRYVEGSEEAFGNSIDLVITTDSLLHSIDQAGAEAWQRKLKGSKEFRHSAAWFAGGVLKGDHEKMLAYQTMYPTTTKNKPRNLVVGDKINWSAAVYTAAMHIAGDVVIQNGNTNVSSFGELTQASKDRLVNQVVGLFEASEIKRVWAVSETAGTMRDTITNAVSAFKIKSNSAKTASNKVETLPAAQATVAPPATPPVHSGFDLSKPPDTLTGKRNGIASSGVVAPPVQASVPVRIDRPVAPATFGFTPHTLPDNDPVSGGRLDVLPQSLGRLDVKRPQGKSWEDHRDDVCAWMNKYFAKVMYGGKAALATLVYNDAMQTYNYAYYKPKELAALYSQKKIQVGVDGSERPVMAPITSAFANWEGTPSYDRVVCDSRGAGIGAFNTWRGFAVAPAEGNDKLARILSHIKEVLCDGNEEVYTYTLDWIASGFQKPEDRGGSALVWKGLKGTGKGLIGGLLCDLWGYHALQVMQKEHVVGKFNGHLEDKRFLLADEAFFAGDKANEGVLKGLITEPRLMIERKGFDAVERPNYIHLLILSNDDFVVPASRDERRYCVTTVNPKYMGNFEYFSALDNDVKDKDVQAAFLYFMLHRDISKYRAGKIPETEALAEQRAENADSTTTWMMRCLQEGGFYSRDATGGHYLAWKDEMSASELYASYLDWIRDEGGVKHRWPKTTTAFGKYIGTLFAKRIRGEGANRARVYTLGTRDEAIKVFEAHEKLKLSF